MSPTLKKATAREMTPQQKHEAAGAESTRPGPMFTPAVDILETETEIVVKADMPGVRTEGLNIDLRDSVLSIEGLVERDDSRRNEHVLVQEYETGGFVREFKLTNLIDQDKIDAKLDNGVLRLTLPKAERARPRKIKVTAG